jgi:tryptophan synthase alpha chain
MSRIKAKFNELRKSKKKAFIAFITAGYPSLSVTQKLVLEFAKSGVDLVELGVPFSDPLADGAIIQESSQYALKKGTNLSDILTLVKRLRLQTEIPLCLMTYYNPVFSFGEERFARAASLAGVDGVIVPDLPPEEGAGLREALIKNGLDLISFVAPTTSLKRMKRIASAARGFIYYVSLTGVTGIRSDLPAEIKENLKRIKKMTKKPVCVGFGISSPAQIRELNKFADGVIVGSAIVKEIRDNINKQDIIKRVAKKVAYLKNA